MKLLKNNLLFILLLLIGCSSSNDVQKLLTGCWKSDKNNLINFTKEGECIFEDHEKWNYNLYSDSLIQLSNTPFDTSGFLKPLVIESLSKDKMILYDSTWSKRIIFTKIKNCDLQ